MPSDGFLNVAKPPGMTSHDVVALARRHLGERRVGHLGTLDPAAAGVLPVSVGRATRLFRLAGGADKAYRAEIAFGLLTDTLDAEGRVVATADAGGLTEGAVATALGRFLGEIEQTPPAYSAVRVGGERLHARARRGLPVEAPRRRVRVKRLELVAFRPGPQARALVDIVCTAGTYVRALADDVGRALRCGACLAFLVRTRAGRFDQAEALSLEEMERAAGEGSLTERMLPPDYPLEHLPALELESSAAERFCHGGRVLGARAPAGMLRVYGPEKWFLGVGEGKGRQVHPRVVLVGGGRQGA